MQLKPYHYELAHPRTSLQCCLLGIIGGCSAAFVIILFRLAFETIQTFYLQQVDYFTTLDPSFRFILPVSGAILIVLFAYLTRFKHYRMGIPYVIHRLKQRYGHIPLRSTINQFFGGMIALASGFSVGREGPSVHLGAAGSSFLGEWLRLPYNSIRILAGCGVAAGISASFNTPFAAVIFVMEVVLREYKIHIFIPVMLSAACGSILTRLVFGEDHEMAFLHFITLDYWMYLYLVILGIFLGAMASLFNKQLMRVIQGFRPLGMASRLLLAGSITGAVGYILPEAMGSGLSAIDVVIASPDNVQLLLAILAGKFFLTIVAIGLGVPGGIIGPIFGIGVLIGAIALLPMGMVLDDVNSYTSSFALLGMAGMMTAVLHAPLAALSAVMELSSNPEVILPAMLVIVSAYVTSTQIFGNSSIFIQQLQYQKLSYKSSSVQIALQTTGVLSVMDTDYKLFKGSPDKAIRDFLEHSPTQLVVKGEDFEIGMQYSLVEWDTSLNPHQEATPLKLTTMEGVPAQATLAEVYEILQASRNGAVYVYNDLADEIIGVINWHNLRSYLHKEHY
ncbi:chloride channel protein [Neptunicella sp.]|uniref:chloride channel protein n=1 Tax=Neptunicella sp. TaxID=2125986 RepID=UPI003F6940EB